MARSRLVIALALALGCAALTGAAFAGPPDDPGKSENAPGQEKKAEAPAPAPAATPPASPGKSANAPGQTKTSKAATPSKGKSKGKSGQATTKVKPAGHDGDHGNQGGRSAQAQDHVIICHRTGSDTNPYVVINIPKTAWEEAHSDVTGKHPPLGDPLRKDILLADADVNPGSKTVNGRTFTKADCVPTGGGGITGGGGGGGGGGGLTTPVTPTGEVAGVEAVVTKPGKRVGQVERPARGGVLGALGAVAGEELPFTGLPLWIAALIGFGLVGAGFGARKAMR